MSKVSVFPLSLILIILLNTGSVKLPAEYEITASVVIPTFPAKLRAGIVAVLEPVPPNTFN